MNAAKRILDIDDRRACVGECNDKQIAAQMLQIDAKHRGGAKTSCVPVFFPVPVFFSARGDVFAIGGELLGSGRPTNVAKAR